MTAAVEKPSSPARGPLRRLLAAVPAAGADYGRDRCPQHAAAISYHLLFSLVPLFMFAVSVFGIVLRDEDVRAEMIDRLLTHFPLTPEAGADLERILSGVPTPASGVGLVSVLALLWSASGMMASVRVGLTSAFDADSARPYAQSKLVDLLLVVSVTVLLLAAFGLSIAVHAVESWSPAVSDWLSSVALDEWGVLANVVPALLAFPAFVLLYRFVPPSHPELRDLWVGALVASLAFAVVNLGFSTYLATVATWDLVYGSLGSILAFLLLVYVQAGVFLFGAELAAAWSRAPAASGKALPAGARIRTLLRGLFLRPRA